MATTTSLSEAYRDTNLQLKHIIPLDFNSIQDLPESHVWTHSDDHFSPCPMISDLGGPLVNVVPTIDLSAGNVVEQVGNACRRWGVFQVTNHGVPWRLVDDVEGHARRLFGLPMERKVAALRSASGATGYGVARISPFFAKQMWHEGFTIMGSALQHAKLIWPHHYQLFCDAMDEYQNKMKSLAHKILIIILKVLGVDEEDEERISSSLLHQSAGALQLNSYPSCPNPSRAMGLAPHTDSLLLTILHQNDTNGLQIFQENMGWISVPPVPGALVVNIGDLMHILSNACFPTVYHRVVPNETNHRFSLAYFYGPPADAVVAPLSKYTLPRFRPVTVTEYIGLKNKHLEKALSLLRVDPIV